MVTDLAARIEDTNVRSEMSNSVPEQLADRICFIAVGEVHMERINAAMVFEDVVTRLSNDITQIMAGNFIDEEWCREFEENNLVGSLFAEARPNPAFQITVALRNKLISVFGDATATRTELQNSQL